MAAASGSAWATSPVGIPSWTRTVIWSASGTSSFPPDVVSRMRRGGAPPPRLFPEVPAATMKINKQTVAWLQVAPLTVVLLVFFGIPMLLVGAVSFFDYERWHI